MADSQRKTANLFDKAAEYAVGARAYNYTISGLDSDKYYTCSTNFARISGISTASIYFGGSSSQSNGVWSNTPRTFKPNSSGEILLSIRYRDDAGAPAIYDDVMAGTIWVMVNEGSTALPYEPYGWVHSLRKLTTSTDTITTLPADLYADGNNATVGLVGNMVLTGTPTPENPITPQETGDKTENLFDYTKTDGIIANKYINQNGAMVGSDEYYISYPIKVNVGETYTWRFNSNSTAATHTAPTVGFYDSSDNLLSAAQHNAYARYFSFEVPTNCAYIRASVFTRSDAQKEAILNTGSTALPYEPYGIKIPISSANTTTPVYLGEVESTRIIGKYEFTGNESWSLSGSGYFYSTNSFTNYNHKLISQITTKWSHYIAGANSSNGQHLPNGYACLYCHATSAVASEVYIRDETYSTAADFKTYLQQQYANGTPVTVWYVLAEPTTGIFNEPIRKIGSYADSITGVTIPTLSTADTFDVGTTLKPSEVSLSYTGWHDAEVKEKSRNLFDVSTIGVENGTFNPATGATSPNDKRCRTANFISLDTGTYTLTTYPQIRYVLYVYDTNENYIQSESVTAWVSDTISFTINNDRKVKFGFAKVNDPVITPSEIQNIMLNTGSTALPYEPYWK